MGKELFDNVVRVSGLAPVIGASTLRRVFTALHIEPEEMTRSDLKRALPSIDQALRIFLPHARARQSMSDITKLTQNA